jgi:putative redox protein
MFNPEGCADLAGSRRGRLPAGMVKITGTYDGGLRCTARHEPSGDTLRTDAPRDNQGLGEAFSPTDLVATAFVTCIATTMALMARKHGHELGPLRYEVTKEMTASLPRSIARLAATIRLPASARAVPAGELERAARGCPVHRSLAPEVAKEIVFVWEDEA